MGLTKNELLVQNITSLKVLLREELQSLLFGPKSLERIHVSIDQATWDDIYATPGSIQYIGNNSESSSGTIYTHQLVLKYPGMSMPSMRHLYHWENQEFILQFDLNNQTYFVGSPEAGTKLSWSYQSAQDGFTLQFSIEDTEPLYSAPELELFIIENGALIQQFQVADVFTLNSDGTLEVEGPNENRYSIDGRKLTIS